MSRSVAMVAFAATMTVFACDTLNNAMTAHTDVVARAAGLEFSVDEAAAMLAPHTQVPAEPDIVQALSNYWVDYVLLAKAVEADSLMRQVDLSTILRPALERQMVGQLTEKVIQVDTAIGEEELRREFEQAAQGVEVRARHILLRQDPQTPQAVRDSLRRLAEQIRDRARAGEDFAELARTHSQDASASQGGDLGFFGRGQMVAPFDSAAFAMEAGAISDIVTSPSGLHIIKVEERRAPDFESNRAAFRGQLLQQRMQEQQQTYLDQLFEPLDIQVQEGAVQNARDIGANPEMRLSGRAASRALVRYEGGELTAGELQAVLRTFPPTTLGQLVNAADDDIAAMLEGLTQNEILVAEAGREGFEISEAHEDSLRGVLRTQLASTVRAMGLTTVQPQDGETMNQAIERKVTSFLEQLLRGEMGPVELGPLSLALREEYDAELFERSFEQVASKVEEMRGSTSAAPPATPAPVPDTGQSGGSTP